MAVEHANVGALADRFDPDLTLGGQELLRRFNRAGVLAAADVHVARLLGELARVADEQVLLAVALAVRAPRMGHVFADLATAASTVEVDTDDETQPPLPWPPVETWIHAVAACDGLVSTPGVVGSTTEARPLHLHGTRLYLDRYWREEQLLADALLSLADAPVLPLELAELADALQRLVPDSRDALQRAAAACGAMRGLTVIAGGPGTGKTTTVAMLLAVLFSQVAADGNPGPLVALCAPTGKAAARLQEAIHEGARTLPVADEVREQMLRLRASTIHRLLGWLPGSRFRHNSLNRLPHDLVIVDETSMVALSLMARLVRAVRSDARMVLVGDPDQLTAIEAGAVLQDIVGSAAHGSTFGPRMRPLLEAATGVELPAASAPADAPTPGEGLLTFADRDRFGDGVVVLSRGHRFGSAIGHLAETIKLGDADGALAALGAVPDEIVWIADEAAGESHLRAPALQTYAAVVEAGRAGDAEAALRALNGFRILCAHRRGPHGVNQWSARVEEWLAAQLEDFDAADPGPPGRPLLITENDHELRLNNGDTGVIVEGMGAVFERDGELVGFAPSRLGSVQRLYAMTIHKSQGSQFETAAVVLPEADSRVLTRELLYTAVTRAKTRLIVVGSEASIRAAVARPVARATGLRELLWKR